MNVSYKGKILLIDDSELVLRTTRVILEEHGFEVITHNEALGTGAMVLRELPDLVMLDLSMPTLNGTDILERMRMHPRLKHTPVIFFSSRSTEELEMAVEVSGADGFIHKTADRAQLAEEVERWLERARRDKPLWRAMAL